MESFLVLQLVCLAFPAILVNGQVNLNVETFKYGDNSTINNTQIISGTPGNVKIENHSKVNKREIKLGSTYVEVSTTEELRRALNDAVPHSFIQIKKGIYNGPIIATVSGTSLEKIMLSAENGSVIVGDGSSKPALAIHGDYYYLANLNIENSVTGLLLNSSHSFVDKLVVENATNGIKIIGSENYLSNCIVRCSSNPIEQEKGAQKNYIDRLIKGDCDNPQTEAPVTTEQTTTTTESVTTLATTEAVSVEVTSESVSSTTSTESVDVTSETVSTASSTESQGSVDATNVAGSESEATPPTPETTSEETSSTAPTETSSEEAVVSTEAAPSSEPGSEEPTTLSSK